MYNRIAGYKQYYKSLVMLGVPIIIGQLGAIITGLADTIMVGQHSTEELAAASFVNNVINAFIIMGTGFSYNLTPLIGQNLAMNKKIVIGGWLKNSLVANMTTTLLLIAVLLGIYLNLDSLGQPEELLPLIRPYFAVSLVSILFVMLYNSFRQFVDPIDRESAEYHRQLYPHLRKIRNAGTRTAWGRYKHLYLAYHHAIAFHRRIHAANRL